MLQMLLENQHLCFMEGKPLSVMIVIPATPQPIMGLYDRPLWRSISEKKLQLQRCSDCSQVRYPPAPVCWRCLSLEYQWEVMSGKGVIHSWVIFHRAYLEAYVPPYNVIAVRLEEGPMFTSNLEGSTPSGNWIGTCVQLCYVEMLDGFVLPRFRILTKG